jgi:hypothetical protein
LIAPKKSVSLSDSCRRCVPEISGAESAGFALVAARLFIAPKLWNAIVFALGTAEEIMQLKLGQVLAIGVGCVLVALGPTAHASEQDCSVGKLQGRYVFDGQGTNLHYGVFDFDGGGKFSGTQTSLRQTNFRQRETLRGTYTLNADCTGAMVMDGQLGGTAHWDIFLTTDGKKGRMIRTDAGTKGVRTFEQ